MTLILKTLKHINHHQHLLILLQNNVFLVSGGFMLVACSYHWCMSSLLLIVCHYYLLLLVSVLSTMASLLDTAFMALASLTQSYFYCSIRYCTVVTVANCSLLLLYTNPSEQTSSSMCPATKRSCTTKVNSLQYRARLILASFVKQRPSCKIALYYSLYRIKEDFRDNIFQF